MAKQKAQQDQPQVPAAVLTAAGAQPADDDLLPGDIAVMQLIESLGGDDDATVRIYRQGVSFKDLELLHECAPDDFAPIMLARPPYNGGTFRIHIRSKSGLMKNRELKVARALDATPAQAPAAAGPAVGDLIATIAAMNAASDARLEKVLQAIAAGRPAENSLSTLDGIKQMADVVKTLMPAPAAAAAPALDFLTVLNAAKELREMTESKLPVDGNGNISEGAVMMTALEKLISRPTPAAAAAPVPALAAPSNMDDDEMNLKMQLMRIQFLRAVKAAAARADPVAYGGDLYVLLSDDDVATMAGDNFWFEKMCSVEETCKPYRPWFELVRAEIVRLARADGLIGPAPAADQAAAPAAGPGAAVVLPAGQ